MTETLLPPLSQWPSAFRKLVFVYTLITFMGVIVGGIMIEVTTHLSPDGIVEQYNGMDENREPVSNELKFPKSVQEMLITTHNHILGLSSIFLITAFLYLMAVPHGWRQLSIALEPLISLMVTFGGLWVVRFVWPPFVYVVILSGTLMLVCYAWMSLIIMKNCIQNPGAYS